ncbi:TPA-induced transmembrane protein [Brachionichthys hirsutus]|uniref:TPA-induced transmembrane protein n=1 Tax=Brachionichthys hirsutus TaxID=412623 RepID=UPI0036053A49
MELELEGISPNKNNGSAHKDQVTAGNGAGVACEACETPAAAETDVLLRVQAAVSHSADNHRSIGNAFTPPETGPVCRIKRELNDVVFWKVRLWMVIVFIFLLIFTLIMITLLVCAGKATCVFVVHVQTIHEDTDENFDPSLFKIPLLFDGTFQMPNVVFTEELFVLSSNQSKALADICQEELADLYGSSPALGRYFSKAEIYAFRNGSVVVDYQLTFLIPRDQQEELRNFTLSREMVYNVFRQFLYDQDTDESGPMFIDPVSLNMFLRPE